MNANELADGLEKYDWYYEHEVMGADGYTQEIKTCNTEYVWNAAAMLRTIPALQAEIERLQRLCESYIRSDYEGTSMFKPFMEELYGKAQEK